MKTQYFLGASNPRMAPSDPLPINVPSILFTLPMKWVEAEELGFGERLLACGVDHFHLPTTRRNR